MGMQDRVSQPKIHVHRPRESPTDTMEMRVLMDDQADEG